MIESPSRLPRADFFGHRGKCLISRCGHDRVDASLDTAAHGAGCELGNQIGLDFGIDPFRRQVRRKGPNEGVVGLHGFDVAAARDGDAIFGSLECLLLEVGGALHGLHEIRNQVGSTLILIGDLGPTCFDRFVAGLEIVVAAATLCCEREKQERQAGLGRAPRRSCPGRASVTSPFCMTISPATIVAS